MLAVREDRGGGNFRERASEQQISLASFAKSRE
jgi:hypothetical protein